MSIFISPSQSLCDWKSPFTLITACEADSSIIGDGTCDAEAATWECDEYDGGDCVGNVHRLVWHISWQENSMLGTRKYPTGKEDFPRKFPGLKPLLNSRVKWIWKYLAKFAGLGCKTL